MLKQQAGLRYILIQTKAYQCCLRVAIVKPPILIIRTCVVHSNYNKITPVFFLKLRYFGTKVSMILYYKQILLPFFFTFTFLLGRDSPYRAFSVCYFAMREETKGTTRSGRSIFVPILLDNNQSSSRKKWPASFNQDRIIIKNDRK